MEFFGSFLNFLSFSFRKISCQVLKSKNIPTITVVILLFSQFMVLQAAPISRGLDYLPETSAIKNLGEKFLVKYGYLESNKNYYPERELTRATKNFQKINNLNPSGLFDRETLDLMTAPRCGMSDWRMRVESVISQKGDKEIIRKKRFNFMNKWPHSNITYGFRSYTDALSPSEQEYTISNALKFWESGTPLNFQQRENTEADIMISFERGFHGDGYPFDGPGKTLAHAFYPGTHERNGDVHFDKEEDWSLSPSDGTGLLNVAIHEIGHALGLEHSSSPDSVMLPYYQGRVKNKILGEKDRAAINYRYGENLRSNNLVGERPSILFPATSPVENDVTSDDDCNLEFDAAAYVRREKFFFKGNNFWRFALTDNPPTTLYRNESMSRFWSNFPENVKVDAVYTKGKKTFIFSGAYYYSYSDTSMDENNPISIRNLSLPLNPENSSKVVSDGIDAAFVWKPLINQNVFFVKGDLYWRYDDERNQTVSGYPKKLSDMGLPSNIDGAFTNPADDEVYFLRGKLCWQLDKKTLTVAAGPKNISEKWFGCSSKKSTLPSYNSTQIFTKREFFRFSTGLYTATPLGSKKKENGSGRADRLTTDIFLMHLCILITFLRGF